jgi:DNA repair exonuclease SbcCD ATPase subunit
MNKVNLDHGYSIINLEKDIMVEHCKGIYNAFSNIIGQFGLANKLIYEYKSFSTQTKNLISWTETISKTLSELTNDNKKYREKYLELAESQSDLSTIKEKLLKAFKDKCTALKNDANTAIEERESLRDQLFELDKKYKNITEEFNKYRQKMRTKYSYIAKNEEKLCKNCHKYFYETDNFNWSCKVHMNQLHGDTYWCCGKVGKDSEGCVVSKHLSKDDSENEDLKDYAIPEQKYCLVRVR